MQKYKILIKLFVLSCVLICCVYGDTIQAKVVVMCLIHFHFLPSDVQFQYSTTSQNNTTTSTCMVS